MKSALQLQSNRKNIKNLARVESFIYSVKGNYAEINQNLFRLQLLYHPCQDKGDFKSLRRPNNYCIQLSFCCRGYAIKVLA